jgi:hypothetical protein
MFGKHVSAIYAVFRAWSVRRLYNEFQYRIEFSALLAILTGAHRSEMYDYITKLCRRQAEIILNHENPNVRAIGQGEPRHRKYKRPNLAADKPTTVQVSNCRFLGLNKLRHKLLHYPALTDVPVCSRTLCQFVFCENV